MSNLLVLPQRFESQDLLRPVPGASGRVLGLDVSEGCGAACVHCTGWLAQEHFDSPARMMALVDVRRRLEAELEVLAGKGARPETLRLGMHSDPFWPDAGTLERTRAVLEVAFERGVMVELHTRNLVPDGLMDLLKKHPHMLKVVMGVMSSRDAAVRVYEADLPPAAGRLKSLKGLTAVGVQVTVRVEPLIPLVNDTEADLDALLEAAVKSGVRRVEFAYVAMTPESAKSLSRGMPRMHREMLKGLFAAEPWQDGPWGARKLLPRALRQAGYDRATAAARRLGMLASVCPLAEPDIRLNRVHGAPLRAVPSPALDSHAASTPPVRVPSHVAARATQAAQQLGLFGTPLKRTAS